MTHSHRLHQGRRTWAARHGAPAIPLRVVLLDDHPIVLDGITALLEREPDFIIEQRATSSGPALMTLTQGRTDAIVLDFHLAPGDLDGVALVRHIRRHHADLAIVVMSGGHGREAAHTAYQAGASAFISKQDATDGLAYVLRKSIRCAGHFHRAQAGMLVYGPPPSPTDDLSVNEIETLRQLSAGASVSQIARHKLRSRKTISSQKRSAMRKLGLSNDLALAQYLNIQYNNFNW